MFGCAKLRLANRILFRQGSFLGSSNQLDARCLTIRICERPRSPRRGFKPKFSKPAIYASSVQRIVRISESPTRVPRSNQLEDPTRFLDEVCTQSSAFHYTNNGIFRRSEDASSVCTSFLSVTDRLYSIQFTRISVDRIGPATIVSLVAFMSRATFDRATFPGTGSTRWW